MCVKLKTRLGEINVENYTRDGMNLITFNSLKKAAVELGVEFTEPKIATGTDFPVVTQAVIYKDAIISGIGEAPEGSLDTDIAKMYPYTTARNRATSAALISLFGLDGKYYTNEQICENIGKNQKPAAGDNSMPDKATDAKSVETSSELEQTEFPFDCNEPEEETSQMTETFEEFVPVSESEELPIDIPLSVEDVEVPEKTENKVTNENSASDRTANESSTPDKAIISFEEACAHKISFECAHKGKTLKELFDAGKLKVIQNIVRYYTSNAEMKADGPYAEAFVKGIA